MQNVACLFQFGQRCEALIHSWPAVASDQALGNTFGTHICFSSFLLLAYIQAIGLTAKKLATSPQNQIKHTLLFHWSLANITSDRGSLLSMSPPWLDALATQSSKKTHRSHDARIIAAKSRTQWSGQIPQHGGGWWRTSILRSQTSVLDRCGDVRANNIAVLY